MNHQTARVGLRERLAFDDAGVKKALGRLHCEGFPALDVISEMVILSTCNRVEIYAVSGTAEFAALESFLSDTRSIHPCEIDGDLYRLSGQEAVAHLFRVTAGLDSLVLGEPQILGQVTQAYQIAQSQNAVGPVLRRLFPAALYAGKRARHETAIGQNPASIASAAIRIAEKDIHQITSARIGILGAGEMAELAVDALRKRGVTAIQVVNRSLERAERLAARWKGQAVIYENLTDVLKNIDILITSTGAPHTLIHRAAVEAVMAERPGQPLVIIDIAVPRDVDLDVAQIPGVHVMDMDTLSERLSSSLEQRTGEIPHVEKILDEEIVNFERQLRMLEAVPLIVEIREQAEAIRRTELEKTLRKMGDLSLEETLHLERMTQALVKKMLHSPITYLKDEAGSPNAAEASALARRLFGLEDGISQVAQGSSEDRMDGGSRN